MGLLDDITDELRGDDETDRDESGTATDARDDTAADRTPSSSDSDGSTDRDGETAGQDGETTGGEDGDSSGDGDRDDGGRDDGHVCSFCQTEFDADRGSCPECDAELVLRGAK